MYVPVFFIYTRSACLVVEAIPTQAPHTEGGFFVVPKVVA